MAKGRGFEFSEKGSAPNRRVTRQSVHLRARVRSGLPNRRCQLALLSGAVAALVAYILARHTSSDLGQALAWSGASFLGITYLVFTIEEKLGL
ncbi:hypothetical protein [Streptomyces lanatus]|uniref:Integral membrane protein n=1 Tax=Streptomyces lanatus TaxID=66900 RepID=A0ABV1Y3P6_9ACTN|nr:hypothetical protein [Streptomyces lanatus]GHH27212.1 hypothetical protein GCM10018780_81750 [Streptomyces lanatus]